MIRTVVLSSRENFVWLSMQEIIPCLVECWRRSAQTGVHEVEIIDVDEQSLSTYANKLMTADNVVLSCFTHKLARLATLMRSRLQLPARFFFHLHNQASIGCWPLQAWGLAQVLREDDVFLSSCTWDARALPLAFDRARVEVVPFTVLSDVPNELKANATLSDFIYIGRISAQKNLHALLLAFDEFMRRNREFKGRLVLYGGADHLGSPNMGLRSRDYLERLKKLSVDLGIEARVRFEGHTPREALAFRLQQSRYIFVSPSLHSDENFGMAAFHALLSGRLAVLTRWGGHADYAQPFRKQVFFVPVQGHQRGPWVRVQDLVQKMEEAWQSYSNNTILPHRPLLYKNENVVERYRQLALTTEQPGAALQPTDLALKLNAQRESFKEADPCRVFFNYADPCARPFFAAYGMEQAQVGAPPLEGLRLLPWAKLEEGQGRVTITIDDPHRGIWTLVDKNPHAREFQIISHDGCRAMISAELARELQLEGWAFSTASENRE